MSKARKREAFFRRTVAAYQRITGVTEEVMACPQCYHQFSRADLKNDRLSLEHVPPESMGGRPICVTCKQCNSAAGALIDRARSEFEKMRELTAVMNTRKGSITQRVKLTAGGIQLNATMQMIDNTVTFHTPVEINDPTKHAKQMEYFQKLVESGSADYRLSLSTNFRMTDRRVFVSNLRAAYLAAFAFLGYIYTLKDNVQIIRRQIEKPDEELVPLWSQVIPSNADIPDRLLLFEMEIPFAALAVYVRPWIVLLPHPRSKADLYSSMSDLGQQEVPFTATVVGEATWPRLWFDFNLPLKKARNDSDQTV